jgi:hypothetical protein
LYNITEDIGEKNNMAAKLPDKTKQMHKLLQSWRKSVNAPLPIEPNPEYVPDVKDNF